MPEQHPFFGGETRWPSEAAAKLFGPSLKKDVSTFIHDTPIYSVKMPQASTWSCVFSNVILRDINSDFRQGLFAKA